MSQTQREFHLLATVTELIIFLPTGCYLCDVCLLLAPVTEHVNFYPLIFICVTLVYSYGPSSLFQK
jgi:hypothetical protein